MGFFKDKLDEFIGGAKDVLKAPGGLINDLWSASRGTDNPLTGDELQTAFGQRGMQGISGLGDMASGVGLKYLYEQAPGVQNLVRGTFENAELLWNHEYQKEKDSAGLIGAVGNALGQNIEPGEISMSKALGTALGTVGSGIAGDFDEVPEISEKWRKSDTNSPGQMLVNEAINLYDMPPEKQEEIKNTSGYVFATGFTDGVGRWIFDPLVVAGKGSKKYSQRYGKFMGVERIYGKATKKIERKIGRELKGVDDIEQQTRAWDGELGPALKEGENAYIIMDADEARSAGLWDDVQELNLRNSEGAVESVSPITPRVQALLLEAKKKLPQDSPILDWDTGGDLYHYIDISKGVDTGTAKARELFDFFLQDQGQSYKGVNKLRWVLNKDNAKLPNANDLKLIYKIIDEKWKIYEESTSAGGWAGAKGLTGEAKKLAKELGVDGKTIRGTRGQDHKLGNFYDLSPIRAKEIVTEIFLRKLDESYPGSSTFTSRLAAANKKQLDPGEQGKVIFFDKDEALGAAKADAQWRMDNTQVEASLGKFNLENPSVVVEINPQGLPVVIPRWDPEGGWLITDVSKIDKSSIVKKDIYNMSELPETANAPSAFWTSKGVKSPRLYEDLTEARKANERILNAYEQDGPNVGLSENMMANIIMQDEYGKTGLLDELINHPRIKRAVDIMEGKKSAGFSSKTKGPMGADEIYKYFLKDVPGGDKIASMLAKSKGTEAKMEVMMAIMGLKMPRSMKGIPGEVMFELNNIRFEMDLIKANTKAAKTVVDAQVDAQVKHFYKGYKKLTDKGYEDIDLKILKEIEEIDEFIEQRFAGRNLSRPIEEYWQLNPDEAQKALLDLELQEKLLAKKQKLMDQDLQKAIDVSTAEEVAGMMKHVPQSSIGKKLKHSIRSNNVWQSPRFSAFLIKPIKSSVEIAPRAWINLSESNAHLQIERWVQEARARFGNDLMSIPEISKWTNRFLNQARDVDRLETILALTEEVIKRAGKQKGFDEQTMQSVIQEMKSGSYTTKSFLDKRRYGPQRDPDIRTNMTNQSQKVLDELDTKAGSYADTYEYFDPELGEYVVRTLPVMGSQLANWVPLTNLKSLQREMVLHGKWIEKYGVKGAGQVIEAIGEGFYSIWKPSVLLRGAWPIRVVSDEQLRILARGIGLQNHLISMSKTPMSRHIFWDTQITKAGKGTPGAILGTMLNSPIRLTTQGLVGMSKIASKIIEINPRKKRLSNVMDLLGDELEPLVSARAGFSTPTDNVLAQYGSFLTRQEQTLLSKYGKKMKTGEYKSIPKGGEGYSTQWIRALNYQINGDKFGKIMVRAARDSFDEAYKLYDNYTLEQYINIYQRNAHKAAIKFFGTEQGKAYSNRLPWRTIDNPNWKTDWADDIADIIMQYTMINTNGANRNTAKLVNKLYNGKLSQKDLANFPEQFWPAVIHGEEIGSLLQSGNFLTQNWQALITEGFDGLGRLPTDVLSRNPMYRSLFALEVERRTKLLLKQGKTEFSASEISTIGQQAKVGALEETQKFMYNIAETPRLGTTYLRFLMPFFAAQVEVISVWSGLARRDPSIIPKANMIWQSPNRARNVEGGLFQGAGEEGKYTIISTDDEGNEYITLMLSEQFTQDKDFFDTHWGKYLADSSFRFNKKSFNMMTGNPLGNGGPIVNIAANEYYIRNPEKEKDAIAQYLLSWGAKGGTSFGKRVLAGQSPTVRSIAEAINLPNDYVGQKTKLLNDVASYMDLQLRNGEIDLFTPEDVFAATDKLWLLYAGIRFYSPASPILDTPLKPYVEAYRELIEEFGPNEGTEKFIQQYGFEYLGVTKGRTVTSTGLPPTVEAEEARIKFEDVIIQYPDYGRLIIGNEAEVGEFSSTVFSAELSRTAGGEFGQQAIDRYGAEREYKELTADDFLPDGRLKRVDSDIAWQKFGRLMDYIEGQRISRGLPNLKVKAAEDLAQLKKDGIEQLIEIHPAFEEAYYENKNVNPDKWDNKMLELEEIVLAVLDPNITNDITSRPDMIGLALYINLRKDVKENLKNSEAKSLSAGRNTELANQWYNNIYAILEEYPAFASIYFRYLEGDPVS